MQMDHVALARISAEKNYLDTLNAYAVHIRFSETSLIGAVSFDGMRNSRRNSSCEPAFVDPKITG
jgi:hypothetical protein